MSEPDGRQSRKIQAEDTKRRILEAALDKFSDQPYEKVAVSEIASAAGVAHGLLFHYFKNKRGIYLAAMEEASKEIEEALAVDPDLSPGAQLRQMYYNQFRYLTRNRGLAMRLIRGGKGADPQAWQHFEDSRWRAVEWGMTVLGLDPESPALRIMMRSAAAAMDEAAANWHAQGQPFPAETMTDVFFEVTVAALHEAGTLDPSLEVARAIKVLRDS